MFKAFAKLFWASLNGHLGPYNVKVEGVSPLGIHRCFLQSPIEISVFTQVFAGACLSSKYESLRPGLNE